jgi:hypothetical protein
VGLKFTYNDFLNKKKKNNNNTRVLDPRESSTRDYICTYIFLLLFSIKVKKSHLCGFS